MQCCAALKTAFTACRKQRVSHLPEEQLCSYWRLLRRKGVCQGEALEVLCQVGAVKPKQRDGGFLVHKVSGAQKCAHLLLHLLQTLLSH